MFQDIVAFGVSGTITLPSLKKSLAALKEKQLVVGYATGDKTEPPVMRWKRR